MEYNTYQIRNGYDKKTCIVHARMCAAPNVMYATAQNLDVSGSDLFSHIKWTIYGDTQVYHHKSKIFCSSKPTCQ